MPKDKKTNYAGGGIGIGAALGMLFGLLLSQEIPFSIIIGAAVGLILGVIWESKR